MDHLQEVKNVANHIFPNPSDGQISISAHLMAGSQITVRNQFGSIVYEKHITEAQIGNEINLNHLQSGTYFMSYNTDKGFQMEKIIIIK